VADSEPNERFTLYTRGNVGEVFPFHQIGDVRYVRIEIDILAQEMRAVSQPGK
jgi:hypothetical protein